MMSVVSIMSKPFSVSGIAWQRTSNLFDQKLIVVMKSSFIKAKRRKLSWINDFTHCSKPKMPIVSWHVMVLYHQNHYCICGNEQNENFSTLPVSTDC